MEGFSWFNEPLACKNIENGVEITTKRNTDFWQRTDYGFQKDDGHFLFKRVKGDFVMTAETSFKGEVIYDQCGIMVRYDSDNWIKASTEFENEKFSHLGAVVTNNGYSDWSTCEIPPTVSKITYFIERKGNDFTIKAKLGDGDFTQIRVTHFMCEKEEIMVGVYACSPQREGFVCQIKNIDIKQ